MLSAGLVEGCSDPLGPELADRWGGQAAELDATVSPPSLLLAGGTRVQFREVIPLDADGTFHVEGDLESSFVAATAPIAVSGRVSRSDLALKLVYGGAAAGTPAQQSLLHRGRRGDFPSVCAD